MKIITVLIALLFSINTLARTLECTIEKSSDEQSEGFLTITKLLPKDHPFLSLKSIYVGGTGYDLYVSVFSGNIDIMSLKIPSLEVGTHWSGETPVARSSVLLNAGGIDHTVSCRVW